MRIRLTLVADVFYYFNPIRLADFKTICLFAVHKLTTSYAQSIDIHNSQNHLALNVKNYVHPRRIFQRHTENQTAFVPETRLFSGGIRGRTHYNNARVGISEFEKSAGQRTPKLLLHWWRRFVGFVSRSNTH